MAQNWTSPECLEARHNECSDMAQPKRCFCICHDPVRPYIDLDNERTGPIEVDKVAGVT
jgi:hypothetical protein